MLRTEEIPDLLLDYHLAATCDNNAAKCSLIFLGPPGIGKSTGIEEGAESIAKHLGKEFIFYDDPCAEKILAAPEKYFLLVSLNLHHVEPFDLTGIPKESDIGIKYKQFLWAICLSRTGGMLFLDEFTNIQRLDVITASFKIVLDHLVGFTRFSPLVSVVAAGNSPEDSSVANLLPIPLVDRFTFYKIIRPTIEAWANWMDKKFGNSWDKSTLAYIKQFPDEFLNVPINVTEALENYPTPRSWSKTGYLLTKLRQKYWQDTLVGDLGPVTGEKYMAFRKTKVPDPQDLINIPSKFDQLNLDGKYLASVLVGGHIRNKLERIDDPKQREKEIVAAVPLLKTMANKQSEFVILTIISGGTMKQDIALGIARKEKDLRKMLEQVSTLRMELEV